MKITYIVPGKLDVRGGVKRICDYATKLAARGHDVEIMCEETSQPSWLEPKHFNGFKLISFKDYKNHETDVAIATGGRSANRLARMNKARLKVYSVVMQESLNKPTFKRGREIDRDKYLQDCYNQNWVYIDNSSWLQKLMHEEFHQRCHLIHGGVDRDILTPLEGLRNPSHYTALAYGRSDGWKGGARSARAAEVAAKQIPNMRLISYGQSKGPETILPLHHIKQPTRESLAKIYSSADVFLQSSQFEGFCNTAFEAMACGTPVITTDIRGIEDFCIPNETALFVPVDDIQAMAEAIVVLYKDKDLWTRLRNNGIQMTQKFNWDEQMEKLENIFRAELHA